MKPGELLLKRGAIATRTSCVTPIVLAVNSIRSRYPRTQIIRVLLKYGTDVSDIFEDKSILEIAAQRVRPKTIPFAAIILMQHMAKLQYLNLSTGEVNRRVIENSTSYTKYYQSCLQEIESMGESKLYNNVTILSVLIDSQKVISGYARNKELAKALDENDYGKKFPIYFYSLNKRFHAEVKKQKVWDDAAEILGNIFNFNRPFHPVNHMILSYLRDHDLKFLGL